MRAGRFLVFDLDEDITARFRNADHAVRFARWLARGRSEEPNVVVSDEARSGTIVWTSAEQGASPISLSWGHRDREPFGTPIVA
jgi:transposase-like protein